MSFKTIRYSEIGKIRSGKRLPKGFLVTEKETKNRYIRVRDIQEGEIKVNEVQYISDEAASKISKYIVNTGDIIISVVGTVGSIASIPDELDNAYLTENCNNLLVDENKCEKKYLKYFLLSKKGQNEIASNTVGSTQPKLPIYGINNFNIDLPDLKTQRRIVHILSVLDNKVLINNKTCENLEAQMSAIFKNWFIDFEPFKNDEFIKTDLGMIPNGWSIVSLGEAFVFRRGTALTKNEVSTTKDNDYPFVVYGAGKDIFGYSKDYTLDVPSVLIAAIGAGAGTVSRSYERQYSVTSNAFYVLPRNELDYAYEIFTLRNYNFKDRCSGSAQPMLSYSSFADDRIVFPNRNAIKRFHDVCKPMIESINQLMEQNYALISIRNAILPKLMSGEINMDGVSNGQ